MTASIINFHKSPSKPSNTDSEEMKAITMAAMDLCKIADHLLESGDFLLSQTIYLRVNAIGMAINKIMAGKK